ncbi:MAG: hypothetical protein K2Q26_09025 [Bdellovibrionales bacterium]|nr:hypothetical protein [Bdellovibrionales bacterium]
MSLLFKNSDTCSSALDADSLRRLWQRSAYDLNIESLCQMTTYDILKSVTRNGSKKKILINRKSMSTS